MKRYKNKIQTILDTINNNDGEKTITLTENDKDKTLGYISVGYSSNLLKNNGNLNKDITVNGLDTLDNNAEYTDLVYIDEKDNLTNKSSIHEVGNSEILFDAMFDYIIRSNNTQDSLITIDNNDNPSLNGIIIKKD